MNRISESLRKSAHLLAVAALALGVMAVPAQTPAGSNRPTTVPEGYLITPFGYFHPSCVRQLAEGDTLLKDKRAIWHADGSLEAIQGCNYPRYRANGEIIAQGAEDTVEPTISHSWIEAGNVTTGSSYGELTANWVVPPAPTSNDSEVIYFFPGLEDANDVVSILQPVLGYNSYSTNAWGIASWNCCISGTTYESTPVSVSSGDTIYGSMKTTCAAGTLACATWNVVTEDVTSGKSTTLGSTSADGQTFNWAFSGALEVYNVAQCSDYPANGSLTFTNVALYDDGFNKIASPGWSMAYWDSGLTPQCNYSGTTAAAQTTLDYGTVFTPPQYPTTCGEILPGQGLVPGESWHSCDGRFTLSMQGDSNLVLYEAGIALWSTGTNGKSVEDVVMQGDGNLVVYNTSNSAVWASNTSGHAGAYLAIQNDGNLVVYSGSTALWNSGTCCHTAIAAPVAPTTCGEILAGQGLTPGQTWHSCDGRFTLSMQTDSNLVLYEGSTALWNTSTVGKNSMEVLMQGDGNLVLYSVLDVALWNSGTSGHAGAYLAIQNDGNLVVYSGSTALWNSGTCCH